MKNKFDFSAFFAKNWFYYVLWILLVILAWEGVFSFITKPKKEESVYFFFGVEKAQIDVMYEDLEKAKPEYIRNIDISAYSTRQTGFDSLFTTRGVLNTDVFILPESYCEPSFMKALFYPMDPTIIKEVFGENAEYEKAAYEDDIYGVKIYDKETDVGKAMAYFDYTFIGDNGERQSVGDYYLFFSRKSLHLGQISGSDMDGALILAQAIWNKGIE